MTLQTDLISTVDHKRYGNQNFKKERPEGQKYPSLAHGKAVSKSFGWNKSVGNRYHMSIYLA